MVDTTDTTVTAEEMALLAMLRSELMSQCNDVFEHKVTMRICRAMCEVEDEQFDDELYMDLLRDEYAECNDITSGLWGVMRVTRAMAAIEMMKSHGLCLDRETQEELWAYIRRIVKISKLDPNVRMSALTPAERALDEFLFALRNDPEAELLQCSEDLGLFYAARDYKHNGPPLSEADQRKVQKVRTRLQEVGVSGVTWG